MIYIGIDTGVHTGFAVWDNRQRSLLEVTSMSIHEAMDRVKQYQADAAEKGVKLIVRVEDPRQRTWFGTERKSVRSSRV